MKYRLKAPPATVEAFQMTKRDGEHCNDRARRDFSRWPEWLVAAREKSPGEHGSAWLDHKGTFRVCGTSIETGYVPVHWGNYILLSEDGGLVAWDRATFEADYEAAPE